MSVELCQSIVNQVSMCRDWSTDAFIDHMIHTGLVGCRTRCFWPPGFGSGGNLKVGCGIASGWLEAGSWLFMVFIGHVIKTKNHNHSINKVKNL